MEKRFKKEVEPMFQWKKAVLRFVSCNLVFCLTFFLHGREWSTAHAAERTTRLRLEEAAKRLKVPREMLESPEAWLAQEKQAAQARRLLALEKVRQHTRADEQEARARASAQQAQAIMKADPNAAALRALAEAQAKGLSREKLVAKLGKASPALAEAVRAGAGSKRRSSGTPFTLERAKQPQVRQKTPQLSSWGGGLTPEVKALYAELVGQGAWVETTGGSVFSVEDALRGARPQPVQLASLASDMGLMGLVKGALPAPTQDDLAETPETQRTPEIKALAASLGGRPLALYNYVHTRIAPELYYGSKKGAAATLDEGRGNDFDTASLLIALLRASGIAARYEYGTVRLSLDQAEALTGAKEAARAAFLLACTGIPASATADGQGVLAERAWVRAFVPYGDYRGTGSGGEKLWVRLDAGLKRMAHRPGVNLEGLVHFDFAGYLSSLNSSTPLEIYERQLLAAAKASNLCNTLEDAAWRSDITQEDFRLLPAEHPARVEASLFIAASPPESMRTKVEFNLEGETYSVELSALQGKTLLLRYPGATQEDRDAMAQAGGLEYVEPYRVKVAPTLVLDGVEVKRFAPTLPGAEQSLAVKVSFPATSPAHYVHRTVAGSLYALMADAGTPSVARMAALKKQLASTTGQARVEAEVLHALHLYAHRQQEAASRLASLQGQVALRHVVEGMAGRVLKVKEAYGTPVALAWGHYVLDVSHFASLLPRDSDASAVPELMKLLGHHGSALEHKVWEETLATESVSAVKTLQAASTQGVPVYRLTSRSAAERSKLTGYPEDTLRHIDEALAAGWAVTVPQRPVNYEQYTGRVGYILDNPVTGEGSYRIGFLLNGGESSGGSGDGGPANDCPPCARPEEQVNSVVDMSNGNLRESYSDLQLPGVGLPVVWARTYASQATGMTGLGYGWMHSYGMYLRPNPDGSVTYVTEDWREVRFTRSGDTYTSAPGWYLTLTDLPDGKRLRFKDGTVYEFNPQGQLRSLADSSGNTVQLVYSNGLLTGVKDTHGQEALSFAYAGNKIVKVTDRAGRSVAYAYSGDDLTAATDVLGHTERYAYDEGHNLVKRTDKLGHSWLTFYDSLHDRWVGREDPLGHQRSAFYDRVTRRTVYVDGTGATWTYEYNAAGNPTATTDPLGNRAGMSWDANFNKLSLKDARGFTTAYEYDARGNLTKRKEPDGRLTTYTYDSNNRVLSEESSGLPTLRNTYDSAGRLTSSDNGLGTTTYAYDARGQLTTVTAPGNAVTRLGYGAHGSPVALTEPGGGTTTLDYDAAGHLVGTTDANGGARVLEVDAAGRVTAQVDALGGRTEYSYDAEGNRLAVKDAAGSTTRLTYDAAGRLTQVVDALGGTTRTEYDAEGRPVARTDARGGRTLTRYDAAGRVVEVTSASGSKLTQAWCADVGTSPCALVDALGYVTTTQFDAAGRELKVVDALGRETRRAYDAAGRLVSESGPNLADTSYTYNAQGLLQRVTTGPLGVAYQYDARGNRTQVEAAGQTTKYTYDAADRLLSEENPLGAVTSYVYDAVGNRVSKVDANGKTTHYVHDANGRLLEVRFADESRYEYAYDALGRRTLEKSPSHERKLAHDALGRVKQVLDVTLGRTLTYGYDAAGNRTALAEGAYGYSYAYDIENRLTRVTDGQGKATTFGYDALGRRAWVQRPNEVRTTYAYDVAGQVLSILHARAGVPLAGFAYEYSVDGNRVAKTPLDGPREVYGYDSGDRLTSVAYGTARTVDYTLSSIGNRTQMKETTYPSGTAVNRYTSYSYNSFNQLTSRSAGGATTAFAYDNNGNLLSESTGTQVKGYIWDVDNRLRQVTMPNGQVHAYSYDANGLRVEQVTPTAATRYLLDGASVVAEVDASGATQARYLTHPQGIDEILSFEKEGSTGYPLTDALGSVYALVDSMGQVVRSYSYDVYGERTTSGGGPELLFGYTGREHDASGLRYHRDRYADGLVGRWSQPDRLGFVDGPNVYGYVKAKPTMASDPSGQNTMTRASHGLAAAIIAGDVPMAMYWLHILTGVGLHQQQVIAHILIALVDEANQVGGACGTLAAKGVKASSLWRTHAIGGGRSSKQVVEMAASMKEKGFLGPPIDVVISDGKMLVVDGHHRLAAAKMANLAEVPINVITNISLHPSSWRTIEEVAQDAATVGPNTLRLRGKLLPY